MIAIPDPCNEDFTKMTPTEKGAFCNKCSTDTYDFRNLSNLRINQIIAENKGQKICGQFKSSQLIDLNKDFKIWQDQNKKTFQSKFILALIMVFGLTLFSCEDKEVEVRQEINQIERLFFGPSELAYINNDIDIKEVDLRDYVEENFIEPIPSECQISGGIDYTEYYETAGVMREEFYQDYFTGGIPAITDDYIAFAEIQVIKNKIDTSKVSTLPDEILNETSFTSKAFPNPTQGSSTIQLEVITEGQFDIQLYNASGQIIQNIHSGLLSQGRQSFEVDLFDQNSGMYFVKIFAENQQETLKIQRVN